MNFAPKDHCFDVETSPLLDIAQARTLAVALVRPLTRREDVRVEDASGCALTEDLYAHLPLPPFDQSAMDGYAYAAASLSKDSRHLRVVQYVEAGSAPQPLVPGEAARIFTGAPLPPGADTVVMQEHVRRTGDIIAFARTPVARANVRRRGEDVARGSVLLESGTLIDARHIALLASQGIAKVLCEGPPTHCCRLVWCRIEAARRSIA